MVSYSEGAREERRGEIRGTAKRLPSRLSAAIAIATSFQSDPVDSLLLIRSKKVSFQGFLYCSETVAIQLGVRWDGSGELRNFFKTIASRCNKLWLKFIVVPFFFNSRPDQLQIIEPNRFYFIFLRLNRSQPILQLVRMSYDVTDFF